MISFIFDDGKGIEIIIEFVSSINVIFSFSTLSDISSQISFKSSNWIKYLFSFITLTENILENILLGKSFLIALIDSSELFSVLKKRINLLFLSDKASFLSSKFKFCSIILFWFWYGFVSSG